MKFHYEGMTKSGKRIEGTIEAESSETAAGVIEKKYKLIDLKMHGEKIAPGSNHGATVVSQTRANVLNTSAPSSQGGSVKGLLRFLGSILAIAGIIVGILILAEYSTMPVPGSSYETQANPVAIGIAIGVIVNALLMFALCFALAEILARLSQIQQETTMINGQRLGMILEAIQHSSNG